MIKMIKNKIVLLRFLKVINQLEKIALNIFVIHSDRAGVIRNTSLQFFGSKKRERKRERKNRLMYWKLSLKSD